MSEKEVEMRFYSQEWLDALKAKSETDPEYIRNSKGLTAKIQNILTDYPDEVDVLVEFEINDGKMVRVERVEKPVPSDLRDLGPDLEYLSRASGMYEAWAKMNRREITPMQALATKIYKIDGDMPKILAIMGKYNAITDLQRSIPCEY